MNQKKALVWITQTKYSDIVKKGNEHQMWDIPEELLFDELFVVHLFGNGSMGGFKRRKGSSIVHVEFSRREKGRSSLAKLWQLLASLRGSMVLVKNLKKRDLEITLRSTNPFLAGLVGVLLASQTKARHFISIHADYRLGILQGCKPMPLPIAVHKWLFKITTSRADKILPISKYIARRVAEDSWFQGAPISEPIYHYIPWVESLGYEDDSRIYCDDILVVARLSSDKYSGMLPEIIDGLDKEGWSGTMHVLGDGNMRNYLEERCQELPVKFYGFVDEKMVQDKRMKILFCLCLCDGASLIEAQMAGNVCVVTPNEWHSEVIVDRHNGFVTRNMRAKEICYALREAVSLKVEERRRMSNNSVLMYRRRFSLDAVIKSRKAVYEG